MLVLPIKKQWFDMIRSGEKKEEYREIKPYWASRIGKALLGFPFEFCSKKLIERKMREEKFDVIFRNGYSYNSPEIWCTCKLRVRTRQRRMGSRSRKRLLHT